MYVYAIVESSKKEHLRQWNKVVVGRLHPSALPARLARIKAKQFILVAVLQIKDFFTPNYKQQAHVPACVLGFSNKRHTLFLSVERRCIHHTWPSPTTELSSLWIKQEFVRALVRHAGGGGECVVDKFEVRLSGGARPRADLSWVARAASSVSLRVNSNWAGSGQSSVSRDLSPLPSQTMMDLSITLILTYTLTCQFGSIHVRPLQVQLSLSGASVYDKTRAIQDISAYSLR